jgi:hypothetical protein
MPNVVRYLVSRVAMMEEIHLAEMSPKAMPRHLFGSDRSPFFGRMLSLICWKSIGWNWSLFQKRMIVSSKNW